MTLVVPSRIDFIRLGRRARELAGHHEAVLVDQPLHRRAPASTRGQSPCGCRGTTRTSAPAPPAATAGGSPASTASAPPGSRRGSGRRAGRVAGGQRGPSGARSRRARSPLARTPVDPDGDDASRRSPGINMPEPPAARELERRLERWYLQGYRGQQHSSTEENPLPAKAPYEVTTQSFSLPAALLDEVKEQAKLREQPASALVKEALEAHLVNLRLDIEAERMMAERTRWRAPRACRGRAARVGLGEDGRRRATAT